MTIQTNLNDRKELARRLIPFNHNEKLHYTGTPAFAYEGQGFRILRSGDIECDDEKTEAAITAFLQEAGILPQPEPEEGTETEVTQESTLQDETPESEAMPQTETEPDRMEIKVPIDGMDGAQLRNLVFMLHAQQYLLNRAAGHENIHVPDRLVEDLKEEPGTDRTSHIHVGAERFTAKTLRNLVNIMASKEDMIYRALQINPSRERRYCRKTNTTFLKDLNRKKPDTLDGIADLWYQEAPYGRNNHYNSTRYHGLNLHATFTKGTVEFRLFNGTLHAGEIKAYIQFCLAVAHQALAQKKASARKTETDNEKYAFRCWMLRLGLIGDEFKTCRLHFLKHLTGNSAWRNAAA